MEARPVSASPLGGESGAPAAAPARSWWWRLAWLPGLLLFLALIAVVTHLSEEERLLLLVRRSQPASMPVVVLYFHDVHLSLPAGASAAAMRSAVGIATSGLSEIESMPSSTSQAAKSG